MADTKQRRPLIERLHCTPHDILEHEGSTPLAALAFLTLPFGAWFAASYPELFERIVDVAEPITFKYLLGFFFAGMVIGYREFRERLLPGESSAMAIILAVAGMVGPFLTMASYVWVLGLAVPWEVVLIPVATDIIYFRSSMLIAGVRMAITELFSVVALFDDVGAIFVLLLTEVYQAFHDPAANPSEVIIRLALAAMALYLMSFLTELANHYEAPVWVYFILVVITWFIFELGHIEHVLYWAVVLLKARELIIRQLKVLVVVMMFPAVFAFAFVTAKIVLESLSLMSIGLVISLYVGKTVFIGGAAIIMRQYFSNTLGQSLQQFTRIELLEASFYAGVGFKVSGIIASIVLTGALLESALLGTNFTIIVCIVAAVISRILSLFVTWRSPEELYEAEANPIASTHH